jgi:hypothetical protein
MDNIVMMQNNNMLGRKLVDLLIEQFNISAGDKGINTQSKTLGDKKRIDPDRPCRS